MSKKIEVTTASLLVIVLGLSVLAIPSLTVKASAQTTASSGKMHLDEGIKALQNGDTNGAMMHLSIADKALSGDTSASAQSGKMHLDEGIKALQNGDTNGAMMHLSIADKALTSG
jgi:hypothetical protein